VSTPTTPKLSHQECWELLPWHANGTLEPEEAGRVDEHLAACAICREELRACRELAASLPGAEADPEPEPGLARVIARIDAEPAAGRRPRPDRRWRALWAATPRPVRATLAAQAAALGALALGGLALGAGARAAPPGAEPLYRTLSAPQAAASAGAVRLRLVFAGDATEAAMRALLLEAGARVVDGPTRFGVYTVELPAGDGGPERLLARLDDHPAVVFAEPALAAPPTAGAAGP
jgi:anti-sigma factor RsiW